ncbi:Transposon TX1 uncharacterized 149 kDa protein [Vitis vinifera]|uniref:Transposon TX1 uncharacterized 149 kDa protein n=1 Tax=Vitis vinifera TaxID=29760 RepID=A0A438HFM9_VITVI|nr:Transposon TX1 uncharacterized 149 kDa protein [Vitis vinifera]
MQPRPGDERVGVEVIYGEVGRADELQAQTMSNLSPPSEIEDFSYGRRTMGCLERKKAQRERGKLQWFQMGDFMQEEKTIDSRMMWSNLFLPSMDRCHAQRSSSEPLPLWSASPFSKVSNQEVDCGTGSQKIRGIRESPIFRCLLSRKCKSWLKEETSTSRGEMDSRKSHLEVDKGGFTGRAGYDPRGSSVTDSPSIPRIRGGVGSLNFVGIPVRVEEENQRAFSNQLSESSTPRKSSNLMLGSPGDNAASPPGDFLIDGLSPRKMAKVREVLCSLDIKVRESGCCDDLGNKKEKCDRRFVSSVWTVRNKDWVVFPAFGALGEILFIWDSKKLCKEEVVLGSFSISVKFALDGYGPLWISAVYGLQEALIRRTSDHWPIALDTNPFMWGPTPFRFENMWLQHPSFKENFRNWWRGFQGNRWEGHKFMRRLQSVKAKLKEWNKLSFGELNEKKKSILNDLANFDAIEQEGGLTSELLDQRALRKGELEELILREEIHWRQKARVKWVKEGDCNSKFFHKVANGRIRLVPYFGRECDKVGCPFTEEEISKAIFQMDRDKAPGLDGFTIAVFQDCWDVIKEDLVRVFAEFHRSGVINQSTNASFIVLLPKKSTTKKISDFRPISLITSLYKIIAKVLSRRLRGVLHETIHSTQGSFVQGRQIMDAVLIANEIVDERRRSGEEGVVFKIDFEKAYDHVRWDFLDQVLEKKGFSPKWRKWMSGCLSSVPYAVLVNGSAKADVLSRMLLRAEERNMLEGFRVGRNRTKVNLDKSNIYGINLDQAHLSRLVETLECKASGWPILYLGLPLGGNPRAGGFWDPVIERISRRLDGWQKTYLSFGGRITLIQSCLTHMPCYFLSLFKLPASVAAKIERLQRDFLWSGIGEGKRDHLVRWDVVCKPKEIGSLGFGNSSLRNLALLGKWLWSQMVTLLSLEGYYTSLSGVFLVYSVCGRKWGKNLVLGRFVVGDQPLGTQYPRLFRVVLDKNIPISSVLGPTSPFSWNLNFRRNLTDSEIEDLEGLMRSLDELHLSPSVPDNRFWPLSSSELFSVKSFFLALSQFSGSPQVFLLSSFGILKFFSK